MRLAALVMLALTAACLPENTQSVTLSPATPEVEAALRAADARWEAAGVDPDRIVIGPGGAPVTLRPERGIVSETRVTYAAEAFRGVKWVELSSLDGSMVLHEMGHALGIQFHPDDPGEAGTEACAPGADNRPLMCSHVGALIGSEDLSEACAEGGCEHFTPEAE